MADDQQTQDFFEMTEDLAEAYRQLRDHVAGSDLIKFVDNLDEQMSWTLKNASDEATMYRAQGFASALDTIRSRFIAADEILAENIERLKP